MTDSTLTPDSLEGAAPATAPAMPDAGEAPLPAPPSPRRTRKRTSPDGAATAGPFRVATANVQSFPVNAITLAQALEDLRRNAADGDLVLLQEIAARYRTLVQMAFPASEWVVYYGRSDNSTPIAFRRELFSKVEGRVDLLHPARKHLHARRYMTYLRLRSRVLDLEFHVTNLHMVAGAFNGVDEPDQALRLEEWNEGIAMHQRFVENLVETGLPVVGGGDYNRRLDRHRSLGTEIAGKPVTYAVDGASIDLLWFIDGDEVAWGIRSTKLFPSRRAKNPARHSDHGMRRATAALTGTRTRTPAKIPTTSTKPKRPDPPRQPRREPSKPTSPPRKEDTMPGAFELTMYGDGRPKRVDWKTRAALEATERLLGYPLTIVQGSYNGGGVSASAGTHDAGGVVDLLSWDWQRKVRALRTVGFAAWYRPPVRGLWGPHIHAVLIDHGKLAPVAARQVTAYRNGRDGLRSNLPDRFWRPSPIPVFHYPPKRPAPTPDRRESQRDTAPARSAFPPKRTLDGVDTSHFQGGKIDVKAAQAAGLRWWYLKATEGDTIKDATYRKRVKQARAAGVPVGAYHFARPDPGDAQKEARFFLANADIRAGDMSPMLDLESLEGMSLADVTRWTGLWVDTVTRDLRRRGLVGKPIIYTPFDLGNGFGCLLWVARYSDDFRAPKIPKPWQRATIWQHSNGRYGPVKHVPGFGPVDVNALHPDVPLSALRVKRVRRPADTPAPVPGPTRKPRRPAPSPKPPDPVGVPALPEAAPSEPALPEPVSTELVSTEPGSPEPETAAPVPAPDLPDPVALPAPPELPELPELPSVPETAPDVTLLIDLAVARVQLETAAQQLAAALDRLPER